MIIREEDMRREKMESEYETQSERDSKIREIRGLKRILTEDFCELTKW